MALGRRLTINRNPPVNRSTNRNTPNINSGIDTQMLNQLIATRVAEALTAAAVTHAASTQEETNLSALTWWNVYVHSVTLNAAHTTLWNDFKAMFIWKYCPQNEVKQMENELWNLKEFGENSGDKRKWKGNHYNNNNNTNNCGRHHTDACPPTFYNCGRAGHKAKECQAPPRPASQRGPGTQGG
ncbi:putative reverse transcriptase domain-containing protein [Tanacetum coccineum]